MKASIFNKINLVIFSLLLLACNEISKEVNNWGEVENNSTLPGNFHFLSDQGIKIFLPKEFEKYSLSEYQSIRNSVFKKEELKRETERLNVIQNLEGNLYIFHEVETQSNLMINTVPYFQFSKESASQLLNIVKIDSDNAKLNKDLKYTKITAKFGGDSRQQLFKAIYKVENTKSKTGYYNTTYIISSNEKTIILRLTTKKQVEFDPYIEKINM